MANSLIVTVDNDADLAEVAGNLRNVGAEVVNILSNLSIVEVRGDKEAIEAVSGVIAVEDNTSVGI
jgi:DNA gyrase/topoisomerase IV subunit B